jgi:hypothetical protein
MDPEVVSHAQQWATKNRWYKPQGTDPDSRLMLSLDAQVHEDGFDPRTPEYWEELDERARKYLPHRYSRRANTVASRGEKEYEGGTAGAGSPVSGSDREVRGRTGSGSYVLSRERVEALKESGMWDDPEKRAKMIKRYQEADQAMKRGE